ncbi:MAG: outer membrane protein assembly factor BamA [Candidatus Zixiibacteriota bacterium]|nr:MAG: outer membrane protein assembly factor BamA [candidate division Zixibacteria bacterium]
MSRVRFGIVIISALLTLGANQACGNASEKVSVRSVRFEGNSAYTEGRLKGLMLTRQAAFLSPSKFHPEIFEDDLNNVIMFYRQNGYLEAALADTSLSIDTVDNSVNIVIGIKEGELTRIEDITIFGNEFFSDSMVLSFIKLRRDDPLKRPLIEDAVSSILSRYAENGFIDVSVTPEVKVNSESHLAMVDFLIKERYRSAVDSIAVTGLEKTRRHVVKRELQFRSGEYIKYSRLLNSQRSLYLTGLFESVFIRAVPNAVNDSTKKNILIEIREKESSEIAVSLGYGSVERIRGRIELNTGNLRGTARKTGIAVEANFIKQGIAASFSDPWTFGTRWQSDLNLFFQLRQEPGYDARTYGGKITVGRKLSPFTKLSQSYRFENTKLSDIKISEQALDIDPRIRSLILALSHDTRDNLFNSQKGIYLSWSNELAGSFLKGSNTFVRSILIAKHFRSLGRESVLGSAFEIGWMDSFGSDEEIPLNERFYSGGPTSLRGFGYQLVGPLDAEGEPIGGKFKIVWNVLELRRSIYKIFGGAVFIDAGDVWTNIKSAHLKDIRFDVGLGLRLNSPIGIARLDYGFNVDPGADEASGKLYLGMGQAF